MRDISVTEISTLEDQTQQWLFWRKLHGMKFDSFHLQMCFAYILKLRDPIFRKEKTTTVWKQALLWTFEAESKRDPNWNLNSLQVNFTFVAYKNVAKLVAVDGCLRGVSWMYFWGSPIWCTSRSLKPKDGYSFFNAFVNRDLNQQISHEAAMDSVSLRREWEAQTNGGSETKLHVYLCP